MWGKKSSRVNTEFFLILDIHSSSVGATIVGYTPEQPIRVVYTLRQYAAFDKEQNGESFVKSMTNLFRTVSQTALSDGFLKLQKKYPGARIKNGFVFYASPWYRSHIKEISWKKDKLFTFKHEDFEKFVAEQTSKIQGSEDIRVIEKDITHVVVNGYEVDDPFDKKVRELNVSLYISEMDKDTFATIRGISTEIFPAISFVHKTHPIAMFSTIRNVFAHTPTFMFIDIGGEMTDIGIIERNTLVQTISIPYGRNNILREIMDKTNNSLADTSSMIQMIFEKTIHDTQSENILKIIEEIKVQWIDRLKKVFDSISMECPRDIFLNSEIDVREMFKGFMEDERLYVKEENTTVLTNVITLQSTTFNHLIEYDEGIKKDSFTEIESIFLQNNNMNI